MVPVWIQLTTAGRQQYSWSSLSLPLPNISLRNSFCILYHCSYAAYQKSKGQQATYKQYYYTFRAGNQQEESATEVQQGEQDEQQQNQNGGRMLEQLYKKIDCETCGVFGCFREDTTEEGSDAEAEGNEDYQYNEVNTENIAAWVDAIGKCKKTDALLDDLWPLYAGFMCNENGSGVDIALFLDEDCTVYTSRQSFKKVANANDQAYMYEAEDMITYPFKNDISCQTEVEYLSYHDYFDMQMNYNYQNNNNNNQNYGDANDFCQNMFEDGGEGKALSLRDCNQDGDEDDQETDAQVNYYSYDYYWYDFVLSYQDSLDLEATCMVLQSMNGEYESVYKYSGSGGIYDYSNSKSSKRNSRSHYEDYFASVGTMEAEVIAAIVSAVAVAVLVLGCIIRSCLCKNGVEKKYGEKYEAHMEALEKKRCLVDDKTGSMLM